MTLRPRLGQIATPGAADGEFPRYDAASDRMVMGPPPSGIQSIVAGDNITVDATDPAHPIVTAAAGGGSSAGSRVDDPGDTLWAGDATYDQEFEADASALPAGWSWVNQGTATYDQKFGCGILDHPGVGSGDDIKLLVRSVPAASTWTATGKASASGSGSAILGYGLALRESATGKFATVAMQNNGANSSKWNSPTSYNGAVTSNLTPIIPVTYFRVRKNSATSWDLQLSADGVGWWKLATATNLSTFMTGTIDQIGFFAHRQTGPQFATALHWFRAR